jgi:hypothetical protein
MSTNAFGSPDLDLRPPEMKRSTMSCWVQECPHCGYCASRISDAFGGSSALLQGAVYWAQIRHPDYPPLANRFLCHAQLQEATGRWVPAGWSSLWAAWACDDATKDEAARECRRRAIRLFRAALERGEQVFHEQGGAEVILVDLLRRVEQMDEAEALAQAALRQAPGATIARCLQFERELIQRRDARVHQVGEAFPEVC